VNPFEASVWDVIDTIREADGRYRREAYAFVMAALGLTVQSLPAERLEHPERRHLSGQELLRGVVTLAKSEFGPMAPTVFREWGVSTGEDVGNIVFQLVSGGQLSARPEDSIDDFRGGPDLIQALGSRVPRSTRRSTHRPGGGPSPEVGT
jgi:uncharacterized repeat protein (TIGR04138 family)